jgi:multiple sugar transport system substrate-binding protein
VNAVNNEWALDITYYMENDPDAKELYPTMVSGSKINGKNYSYPAVMFPHMMFINKTLFEQYNVELPALDWTWEDYLDLADELSHPEEYNFGISNPLYTDLFPAAFNGNQGKFAWDGEKFNFDEVWVEAVETRAEVINNKICEWMSAEEKEAVLGDPGAWPPGKGRTAMHIDWPWTQAMFKTTVPQETGCEFVFYPLPMGDGMGELAIVDNGVIAASTQYPREAWELSKWMSWGPQAALCRQKTYRENGYNVSRMPVVSTPEVWQDLVDNAAEDVKPFFEAVLTRGVNFVPSNWPVAPGWAGIEAYYNSNDIDGKILRGEISAADVAAELQAVADAAVAEALANLPQ